MSFPTAFTMGGIVEHDPRTARPLHELWLAVPAGEVLAMAVHLDGSGGAFSELYYPQGYSGRQPEPLVGGQTNGVLGSARWELIGHDKVYRLVDHSTGQVFDGVWLLEVHQRTSPKQRIPTVSLKWGYDTRTPLGVQAALSTPLELDALLPVRR